jgi:hypothetical protein
MRYMLFVLCCLLASVCASAQDTSQDSEFLAKLKALPGVVDVGQAQSRGRRGGGGGGGVAYDVTFQQPVDHANPAAGTFAQHVFIRHAGYDLPVLLGTEGYASRGGGGGELQAMLGGNQVTVEHRFFGRSVPDPMQWKHLTIKQSADDLHAVVTAMKTLYTGKWVSTGRSKGGQTALFYKCFYPDDMDAVVAFVAPLNLNKEDPRLYHFLETVGDDATRQKIKDYQITMFKREDEILPLVKQQTDERNWTFAMGLSEAYEYGILEYSFAFWQSGLDAGDIPSPDAPAADLAAYYMREGAIRYYSDQGKIPFEPFQYQAFTEMGYYNYDIADFKPYMKTLKEPTNSVLAPQGVELVYNPATMAFVYDFLQYKADRVVYVYGELDAWGATQIQLIGRTDAIKIVVTGAHHSASIRGASPEQQKLFNAKMGQWLGMTFPRESSAR